MGGKLSKKNKSYDMSGGQEEVGGGSPVDGDKSSPEGEVTVTGLKKTGEDTVIPPSPTQVGHLGPDAHPHSCHSPRSLFFVILDSRNFALEMARDLL